MVTIPIDPFDPTGVLAELSRSVGASTEMTTLLDDVVGLMKRRIPGTDEASITLIRSERAGTVAWTGDWAKRLDELQYDAGYGPCLDAARANEIQHVQNISTDGRWPDYLVKAKEAGVGSCLSLPMPVEHYLIGAVNLFSRTPRAFDSDSVLLTAALAGHVTAALSVAETSSAYRDRARNLEQAVVSHSLIDQAKGMIMAQRKCTAEEAFSTLRRVSMDSNIKLYDVAAGLVASASTHPVRRNQQN